MREQNNYCDGTHYYCEGTQLYCEGVTEGHQVCTGFTELIAVVIVTETHCLRMHLSE